MAEPLNPHDSPETGAESNGNAKIPYSNDKPVSRKKPSKKWLGLTKTQWKELAGFAVLIPWIWVDLFDTHGLLKLVCLAFSVAIATTVVCSTFKKRWLGAIVWLFLLVPVVLAVWINSRPEPRLNFITSLEISGSPNSTLILTNDFLCKLKLKKTGNLPNGALLFHALSKGAIFIPVSSSETNKIFTFTIGDSPVDVNGFEVVVAFPKSWECRVDTQKWQKVFGESLKIPGLDLEITNMQYFLADGSSKILYANDQITFPGITIPCRPEFEGNTFKGGLFEFAIRSSGFETEISANLIFVPAETNNFKLFVSDGDIGPDGKWSATITSEEYERSQQ